MEHYGEMTEKNRYQAVGDNGEGRKIIHLLSEVNISGVEDGRPKPKSIFILFSIFICFVDNIWGGGGHNPLLTIDYHPSPKDQIKNVSPW